MVRDDVEAVIEALGALEAGHRLDGTRHFYAVRDEQFNALRRDVHASADPANAYTPALAAMLIYLNRTGYNGLFRLNSRGGFNVPRRTLCEGHDLRCPQPQAPVRSAAPARTDGRGQTVRRGARRGPARGLRLSRSSLRAGQPHGAFHVLHRGEVRSRRAGPPAAGGGGARPARRVGPAQQFGRSGHPPALRKQCRGAVGGPQSEDGRGPPRHQLARVQRGAVREYLITNIV